MANFTFTVENVSRGTVEKGEYWATISSVQAKNTKDNRGMFYEFEFKLDNGFTLTDRYNVVNDNQKAVEIAVQKLQNIAFNSGFPAGKNMSPEQMLNARLVLVVDQKEEKSTNQMTGEEYTFSKNVIKAFRSALTETNNATKVTPNPVSTPPAAPAAPAPVSPAPAFVPPVQQPVQHQQVDVSTAPPVAAPMQQPVQQPVAAPAPSPFGSGTPMGTQQ